MDIRKIQYFFAVIEHGNLSSAAQSLRVSQPTLSRQIQSIEDQFQTPLFVRGGRGMMPTEAGKQLRLDPNLRPLLENRRVVLIDDAVSTGVTAVAAVRLLQKIGVDIAGMVVAMKQTNRWEAAAAMLPLAVRAVYGCPLFERSDAGWMPLTGTEPGVP